MDSIARQLQNPEWWFTVVFAALVIGVVAAYAKDALNLLAAKVFKSYAARAARVRAARERRLKVRVRNPAVLVFDYLRSLFAVGMALAMMLFPNMLRFSSLMHKHFPDSDPLPLWFQGPTTSSAVAGVVAMVSLGLGIWLYWVAMSQLVECQRARRQLFASVARAIDGDSQSSAGSTAGNS